MGAKKALLPVNTDNRALFLLCFSIVLLETAAREGKKGRRGWGRIIEIFETEGIAGRFGGAPNPGIGPSGGRGGAAAVSILATTPADKIVECGGEGKGWLRLQGAFAACAQASEAAFTPSGQNGGGTLRGEHAPRAVFRVSQRSAPSARERMPSAGAGGSEPGRKTARNLRTDGHQDLAVSGEHLHDVIEFRYFVVCKGIADRSAKDDGVSVL